MILSRCFGPFVDRCVLGLLESRAKMAIMPVVRDFERVRFLKAYLETMTKGDKRALIEKSTK